MPYILAILGWTTLLFGGIGLLVLTESLWAPQRARVRARDARRRIPRGSCSS